MAVFILTEGDIEVGVGHISRCLSLYDAFLEINIKASLYIKGDSSINELLIDYNFKNVNWIENTVGSINPGDLVIIDSYNVKYEIYEKYRLITENIVFLDDNSRIDYPNGILLNPTNFAHLLSFSNHYLEFIVGSKYIMLRRPFWDIPKFQVRENLESILVSMGGSDLKDITPKVCELLCKIFPEAQIIIVYNRGKHIINNIDCFNTNRISMISNCSAEEMKQEMINADLIVTTAGQTLYESIRVGTPSLAISIVDNQIKALHAFKEVGYVNQLLEASDPLIWDKFRDELTIIGLFENRKLISKLGRTLIDGQGARRVAKKLKKLISYGK